MTKPEKVSLFEMAEAVGLEAEAWAGRQVRPEHARALDAAHLTLSLMALDEEASRQFIRPLTKTQDGRLLIGTLMRVPPKPAEPEAEAEPEAA